MCSTKAFQYSLLITSLLAQLSVLSFPLAAQNPTPGQNINMVSGTQVPGGDPFLQRQNEPSIAVSTRNPLHLLAGANDYRTVDLPLTDQLSPELAGDAWLGIFKSFDGGATWKSTLMPGFPQDTSALGGSSPLKGFLAASDPVVRAGTNGMFYYSGIAFNRGSNKGVVFVSRFIDLNNKENGNATQGTDPVRFGGIMPVRYGNAGQFLDKPWLAVDPPRGLAGTCSITVAEPGAPGGSVTQTFPAGNVYLAWAELVGNDNLIRTKIYFVRSTDCGATWSNPTKLSEGYPVNQGVTIAVDPSTGYVYVAWRTFAAASTQDSINIVKSIDGGQTFTKGITIRSLPSFDPNNPTAHAFFDLSTNGGQFRTLAFPSVTVDTSGRIYVAWSERGVGPGGDARIVMSTSLDGMTWSTPAPVDNGVASDDMGNTYSRGHQLMPSLSFAGGKLMVLFYDLRLDHTLGTFDPVGTFPMPDGFGRFFLETRQHCAFLNGIGGCGGDPDSAVFTPYLSDAGLTGRRHTIEVMAAQADPGPSAFTTARVSQYPFGLLGDGSSILQQLKVDPPNFPMFQGGTVPFIGDYIDVAGFASMPAPTASASPSTPSSPNPVFYATWTDNRDVRPPADGNWTHYTPVGGGGASYFDPTKTSPSCVINQDGMRNQNIYTSRITQGLLVSSPQNQKPLSPNLQRAFVVYVQNFTNFDKNFHLTIANQPPGGYASFLPGTNNPPNPPTPPSPAPTTGLDVSVAAHSGISRPVFAASTLATATITVNVQEVPSGLSGFVVLNGDATTPPLINPDGSPSDVASFEIYNPNISNPNISNPNISNPNISNPNISNPNISNPNISNPNISNPNISNPNISNPNISNPNISNPNISNPNISNTPVSDATYTLTNTGNTSASYNVKLLKSGGLPGDAQFQLILTKSYLTPVSLDCSLQQESTPILLNNIDNPVFTDPTAPNISNPNISNPNISNATLTLAPGESAFVTIRGNNVDVPTMTDIVTNDLTPAVTSQAANTNDPTNTPPASVPPSTSTFLFFVTQPSNVTVGESFVPTVQVRAQDSSGAVVPGVSVTLVIGSQPSPGGGTLSGTAMATTDVTGVATFTGLAVSGNTGTGFTLMASATGSLSTTSATFSVVPVRTGSVTDLVGDIVGTNADLVSASITTAVPGLAMQFTVHFAAGTFNASTTEAQVLLDTDQNPATGSPGSDSGCGGLDGPLIGNEFLVVLRSGFAVNTATVYQNSPANVCNAFVVVGTVPVTILTDGLQATVPLSMLGNDDGLMNFKVTSDYSIGGLNFSGLVDRMPDSGTAPAQTF